MDELEKEEILEIQPKDCSAKHYAKLVKQLKESIKRKKDAIRESDSQET
jgi:hypothetical protein